jgi:signal transduction histidine kinase
LRTFARQQADQAAELLWAEIQKARDPVERDYLRSDLRLTLKEGGHQQEADDLAVELLSSATIESSGKPFWQTDAAEVLIAEDVRGREVLTRIERDIHALPALARWHESLAGLLMKLRESSQPGVAERADADLKLLARRMEALDKQRNLPQVSALQAAFPTLGLAPERWQPFPPVSADAEGELWFVGMGPQTDGRALVLAVRAEVIARSVEADRRARNASRSFHLVAGGNEGYAMGDTLPGFRAILQSDASSGAVVGLDPEAEARRQQRYYALSVALTLGLAFFGGHLLWRDTRRESRMAELRSQFVSSVSHELKTPLTGIRMLAETLQGAEVYNPQRQAEYLETIVGETERLTRLLNNVLDFSRIERGQRHYHMKPASLAEAVGDAARALRFPLEDQGFDLRMDIAPDVPQTPIDRDAMEQAVINLLSNAMKYSGESRQIDLRLWRENGSARIRVADRGIGIPAAEQQRIFEKFHRIQTLENQSIPGTGLGLALVAHIVEAHRGHIEVESMVGQGSAFTITIPVDPGAAAEKINTLSAVAGASGGEAL